MTILQFLATERHKRSPTWSETTQERKENVEADRRMGGGGMGRNKRIPLVQNPPSFDLKKNIISVFPFLTEDVLICSSGLSVVAYHDLVKLCYITAKI